MCIENYLAEKVPIVGEAAQENRGEEQESFPVSSPPATDKQHRQDDLHSQHWGEITRKVGVDRDVSKD
jgi:hypothetical protein